MSTVFEASYTELKQMEAERDNLFSLLERIEDEWYDGQYITGATLDEVRAILHARETK